MAAVGAPEHPFAILTNRFPLLDLAGPAAVANLLHADYLLEFGRLRYCRHLKPGEGSAHRQGCLIAEEVWRIGKVA